MSKYPSNPPEQMTPSPIQAPSCVVIEAKDFACILRVCGVQNNQLSKQPDRFAKWLGVVSLRRPRPLRGLLIKASTGSGQSGRHPIKNPLIQRSTLICFSTSRWQSRLKPNRQCVLHINALILLLFVHKRQRPGGWVGVIPDQYRSRWWAVDSFVSTVCEAVNISICQLKSKTF